MYGTGLCVTGVTAILFGYTSYILFFIYLNTNHFRLLNLVPAGTTFITLAFIVRIFEAVGDAAIVTAAFAIVAKNFTFRVATIIVRVFH